MLACLLAAAVHIVGNLYSVGPEGDTTSYLFATPQGHILLDAPDADVVLANVRKLGFDPKDIKLLLNSQAHFDHAGGFAKVKAATGAKLEVMDGDAQQIERGGRGDFAFGDKYPVAPAKVDKVLHDGDVVELGGTRLTALKTPGHTKGCTTWTATIDGKRAVFLCSVTAPGYKLTPALANEFRESFRRLAALPCDLFLGSHTSFFEGHEYRAFIESSRRAFEEQLAASR
jgi:metallo-beta-lactamase class B